MKRERHKHIIEVLNKMEVKINFITDGDIAGALSVIGENPKMIFIIALVALQRVLLWQQLSCYGGQIQGRLVLDDEEKVRAKKLWYH